MVACVNQANTPWETVIRSLNVTVGDHADTEAFILKAKNAFYLDIFSDVFVCL